MADDVKQSILNKARADKFILVLTTPTALQDKASKTERRTHHKSTKKVIPDSMQFSVYGTIVPEVSIPPSDQHYSGQSLNISTHDRPTYGPVTVNFTIDNEYNNYWYIYRWLDILNDSEESQYDKHDNNPKARPSAVGVRDPHKHGQFQLDHSQKRRLAGQPAHQQADVNLLLDYQTDMSLFGLDEYNKRMIEFKYTKAFPTTLGSITYSHREVGELESTFSFSFSQLIVNLL